MFNYIVKTKIKIIKKQQNLFDDFHFPGPRAFPNFIKLGLLPVKIKVDYIFFAFASYLKRHFNVKYYLKAFITNKKQT